MIYNYAMSMFKPMSTPHLYLKDYTDYIKQNMDNRMIIKNEFNIENLIDDFNTQNSFKIT